MNFKSDEYKDLYKKNAILFQSESEIKELLKKDSKVRDLIMPLSFFEKQNWATEDGTIGPGYKSYIEYINAGTFISYGQLCLEEVVGMCTQGEPEITLPEQLGYLKDYATEDNTSLVDVELKCIESLFKYGCGLILAEVEEGIPGVDPIFKLKVYNGSKIVDFQTKTVNGNEEFDWILLDADTKVFDKKTKQYTVKQRYRVLSLDVDGNYYSCIIDKSDWSTFSFDNPNGLLSYPSVRGNLTSIPAVMFNIDDITAKFKVSFIQHLLDLSLKIFKMDSTLTIMQLQQGSGHLVIKSSKELPKSIACGRGAIHILKGDSDSEEYVTPDTSGMGVIQNTLAVLKAEANNYMYSLKNIQGSGVSMVISLQSNTNALRALVNVIGNAITRVIEKAGALIDIDEDLIDFIPYSGFGSSDTYQETIRANNTVKNIENTLTEKDNL